MTTSIGWCSVQIVRWVPGIGRDVSQQLRPQMQQAGQQAGQELGDGIADGLAKAEAAVKTASRKLAQSRDAEKDAAAKLSIGWRAWPRRPSPRRGTARACGTRS
ncbi:hypothetical protein GS928_24180 [Rhodococcus hoagii]|nr:hypothetical protein [Prescottella equi]